MIYPEAYYAAHKEASTPEELGRLGFALIGRGDELSPPLSAAERLLVQTIKRCNKWHTEKRDEVKEKWRADKKRQRAVKDDPSTDVHQCPTDNGGHTMSTTSIYLPTYLSNNLSTNRSVIVGDTATQKTERNENGTVVVDTCEQKRVNISKAKRLAEAFASDARADAGAFFAPEHDPVAICEALTGDFKSARRWRQLTTLKGEAAVREEAFGFFREISAGEIPDNRGAALNARLAALPNQENAQ